jgi:hypothetical protein
MKPIRSVREITKLDIEKLPVRKTRGRVLMCTPDYFDVVDVKNYFMKDAVGSVDRIKACAQ